MNTISDAALNGADSPGRGESFATLLGQWAGQFGAETAMTFLDYRTGADARAVSLSWRELDDRVSAVALRAGELATAGQRAAIVAEQSLDYAVAFLGAIRAGLTAVPLFSPALPGHTGKLAAVLADCAPRLVLTTTGQLDGVRDLLAENEGALPGTLAVDTLEPVRGDRSWHRPHPDEPAYLQYTSGSTRTPAGVVLTHRNVLANAGQACRAYGAETGCTTTVSWLPLYHDMGLILGIGAPMVGGLASVLMDPLAFLEQPGRWLRALSANQGAISAAPNFAYAYSASRVSEREKNLLELSRVVSLINGSENVLPSTIAKFQDAFAECGLRPEVHRASYGLAEATVLVSVTETGKPPRQVTFDRDRLAAGAAVPADGDRSTTLVSCGRPAGQWLCIVDTDGRPLPAGAVGEIWVSGPNVGEGYWRAPEASASTFGRTLAGPLADAGSIREGDGDERGWLATGDLGTIFEGELYLTGRLKDLIIVDGRNHYPQDVEQTVEAHPAVRPHSAGAFAISNGEGEAAVVVFERAKDLAADADLAGIAAALRAEVSTRHGLKLHDVIFMPPGGVPRTSSGKISRALCRARYQDGEFAHRRLA
ncbi:fatty acyl-AMP ligase [Amycolatopsis nigrescens]|uniref:fatty acyl-AMP ligase n=1 Tax=Amycolatopsis nigrescens TaxID=381445 RepID=UPI0004770226|nr:fatty acyl-AMP ligase [Amycolatopsis nigrescens]